MENFSDFFKRAGAWKQTSLRPEEWFENKITFLGRGKEMYLKYWKAWFASPMHVLAIYTLFQK